MQIGTLTDKTALKTFLNTDRWFHAYALADLEEPFFQDCRWIVAEKDSNIATVVLLFSGLEPPALLAMGEAAYLPQILQAVSLPPTVMFMGLAAHRACLTAHFQPEYLDSMLRMVLPPERFQPVPAPNVVRLNQQHTSALQTLYKDAHGNAFAPYQLQQGIFYGLFVDNQLASVAGTHIISKKYGVAAVGNVFTRPQYRGRGLAQQVTGAVCQDLLSAGLDVVLNVEAENKPAIKAYQNLGFVTHCSFFEGVGTPLVNRTTRQIHNLLIDN